MTVETVQARSRWIAAVHRSVRIGEVGAAWKPALDRVWAFLRDHRELEPGHNLFLYRHPAHRSDPLEADFGVEVSREFEPVGEVRPVRTPAGEAAHAIHRGPYEQMKSAHDAIHRWAAEHQRRIGGASWELYGHWSNDPSTLETEIFYLLE